MANSHEPNPATVIGNHDETATLEPFLKEAEQLAERFSEAQKKIDRRRESEQLRDTFQSLARQVPEIRGEYRTPSAEIAPGRASTPRLSFCGCLEADLSQWSGLQVPVMLAGGFLLRTGFGNILCDPGIGTLSAMREMGIDLMREVEAIFVSGSHPSSWHELHPLLHLLGRRVLLFCPPALAANFSNSGDGDLVDPHITEPGAVLYLHKGPNGASLKPMTVDAQPDSSAVLLRILPAFDEVTPTTVDHSSNRSGLFVEVGEFGVLFTGSTAYREVLQETLSDLVKKIDVLIVNVHHLGDIPVTSKRESGPFELELPNGHLGFEGACLLAEYLKPKVVVLRSFSLECVLKQSGPESNAPTYAPEHLSIYMRACSERLKNKSIKAEVIIPGRHEIWKASGEIEQRSLVPAFPESGAAVFGKEGECFRTANDALASELRGHIDLLKTTPERPFMIIEGESGAGKTVLANAIAAELIKDVRIAQGADERDDESAPTDPAAAEKSSTTSVVIIKDTWERVAPKSSQAKRGVAGGAKRDRGKQSEPLPLINEYDLAAIGLGSEFHGNVLFGWRSELWTGSPAGHPGLLGTPNGVLILNQLEKLPIYESQRFLDVIESWKYKRRGEEHLEAQPVQVKIIFTTNVPLMECSNLHPDLKNRLIARRCSLPRLRDLTVAEQKRDLRFYATHWCMDNRVFLAPEVMERLHEIDLSNGTIRMLRGLLEIGRFLALRELGLERFAGSRTAFPVYVAGRFFLEAMQRSQVEYIKPLKTAENGYPRDLVCLVAIWISFDCTNRDTYSLLQWGQSRSSVAFKTRLAEFRRYFADSDKAWEYFQGPNCGSAKRLLREAADPTDVLPQPPDPVARFDDYLDKIGAAPEFGILPRLFGGVAGPDWISERAWRLGKILFGFQPKASIGQNQPRVDKVKEEFKTKLDELAKQPPPGSPA